MTERTGETHSPSGSRKTERVATGHLAEVAGDVRMGVDENLPLLEGAVIDGDLHLKTHPGERSRRLILESWTRSNKGNNRSGDVMELRWRDPVAKAFIGWWDYTDPEKPKMKAWIGAHDEANNPDLGRPHRHWSVEVADARGHMQTRLAIPYDRDWTTITTASADFCVTDGALRLSHGPLQFTAGSAGRDEQKRWAFEQTNGPRRNMTLYAYNGSLFRRPVVKFHRESGYVSFGGDHAAERPLHIRHDSAAGVIVAESSSRASRAGVLLLRHANARGHVLQSAVVEDAEPRYSVDVGGAMSWGSGRARRLKLVPQVSSGATNRRMQILGGDLQLPESDRGVILTDRTSKSLYRIFINDGNIGLEAL